MRGWIADVEGTSGGDFKTVETETARRLQIFQNSHVWIDNAPYVSGGVVETGAFMLLDVPPGNVTITFQAPGVDAARLILQNVPGRADVFIPGLILKRDGTVGVADPKAIRVRIPPDVKPATAIVAGQSVPAVETQLKELMDRHDYPEPPSVGAPVTRVR